MQIAFLVSHLPRPHLNKHFVLGLPEHDLLLGPSELEIIPHAPYLPLRVLLQPPLNPIKVLQLSVEVMLLNASFEALSFDVALEILLYDDCRHLLPLHEHPRNHVPSPVRTVVPLDPHHGPQPLDEIQLELSTVQVHSNEFLDANGCFSLKHLQLLLSQLYPKLDFTQLPNISLAHSDLEVIPEKQS